MILILREKDFLKKKEKFVQPKDYLIFDATDNASGNMNKFSNSAALPYITPPKSLLSLIVKLDEESDDDFSPIDVDKVEKLEKKFFKGIEFIRALDVVFVAQMRKDQNIFVVFKDKNFKSFETRVVQWVKKYIGENGEDLIKTFADYEESPKILRSSLSHNQASALKSSIEKLEKKIRKHSDAEDEIRREKKKEKEKEKKKKKDKKKKKKKKWMNYQFDD